MKKKFKILSLVFILFSIFSFLAFSPSTFLNEVNKVCAQTASGISCVPNVSDCSVFGNNYRNLLDLIREGELNINGNTFTQTEVINSFNYYFGESVVGTQPFPDYTKSVCLNTDAASSEIIPFYAGNTEEVVQALAFGSNKYINDFVSGTDYYERIRICPAGYFASQNPQTGGIGGSGVFKVWGCCPSPEYTFVVPGAPRNQSGPTQTAASSAGDAQARGACCLRRGNQDPYELSSGVCIDRSGNELWQGGEVGPGGLDPLVTPGEDPKLNGLIIGRGNLSGALNFDFDVTGSSNICPTNVNDCVIVTDASCIGNEDCTELSDGQYLADPDVLTSGQSRTGDPVTYACHRCYADGEFVGVDDETSEVLICNGGNPTRPDRVEGVNNSVSDTLACLRSGDQENFNLCKNCRESGGVWTGLGCTDTSPTGIITWIIRIAYGVMGGVALIQFIIAGIYYQTGQEEKVREARKNIIATITGLAVLTFSILILRIIGINILNILPVGSV